MAWSSKGFGGNVVSSACWFQRFSLFLAWRWLLPDRLDGLYPMSQHLTNNDNLAARLTSGQVRVKNSVKKFAGHAGDDDAGAQTRGRDHDRLLHRHTAAAQVGGRGG